jgi:hypothetical protein
MDMGKFKVLSQHMPGGVPKNISNAAKIWTWLLPNTTEKHYL